LILNLAYTSISPKEGSNRIEESNMMKNCFRLGFF
jgi:hypothetical protein